MKSRYSVSGAVQIGIGAKATRVVRSPSPALVGSLVKLLFLSTKGTSRRSSETGELKSSSARNVVWVIWSIAPRLVSARFSSNAGPVRGMGSTSLGGASSSAKAPLAQASAVHAKSNRDVPRTGDWEPRIGPGYHRGRSLGQINLGYMAARRADSFPMASGRAEL